MNGLRDVGDDIKKSIGEGVIVLISHRLEVRIRQELMSVLLKQRKFLLLSCDMIHKISLAIHLFILYY